MSNPFINPYLPAPKKYWVTGVWYKNGGGIESILTHEYTGNGGGTLNKGIKMSEAEVLKEMDNKSTFTTLIWNYEKAKWDAGMQIDTEQLNNRTVLRTHRDKTRKDNLGNLLPMFGLRG